VEAEVSEQQYLLIRAWKKIMQQIKIFLAGGFLALALVGAAIAGPFEDGLAAYDRGDYIEATRSWRPLAEQGNPSAQLNLGSMYANGQGVTQDNAQAVAWFRKAAEKGSPSAQYNLGNMFESGSGVTQDYAQALAWFRKAA
jgi:uncharacterized protein